MERKEDTAMSKAPYEAEGTLKPDGTIVLDKKPDIASGRVRVIIEHLPYNPDEDPFMIGLRAIREAQKARGHVPRTKEEIDAELKELGDDDERHMQRIEKLYEEAVASRKQREKQEGPSS
jgi:hypothetical protein